MRTARLTALLRSVAQQLAEAAHLAAAMALAVQPPVAAPGSSARKHDTHGGRTR